MASQEVYLLEGKLKRTVYAITYTHLIQHIATLNEEEAKILMKGIKKAIADAVDESMSFLTENEIIEVIPKKRKKSGKKR